MQLIRQIFHTLHFTLNYLKLKFTTFKHFEAKKNKIFVIYQQNNTSTKQNVE